MVYGWWLLHNYLGGAHIASGRTAADAKAEARLNIAEAFAEEGLSPQRLQAGGSQLPTPGRGRAAQLRRGPRGVDSLGT